MRRALIASSAPLLIAATPDASLSTGALVALTAAIAGVVILRGVFLRHFTRRRTTRRSRDDGYAGDSGTSSSDDRHGDHGSDGGDSGGGDGGGGD